MAIITASVDTEKDTVEVTIDGKKMKDVWDFSIYRYMPYDGKEDDKPCCSVSIGIRAELENGLVSRTYISKAGVTDYPPEDNSFLHKALADINRRCGVK